MKALGPRALGYAVLGATMLAGCTGSTKPSASPPEWSASAPPAPADWTKLTVEPPMIGGVFGGDGNDYPYDAVAYGDGFIMVGETFRTDDDIEARIWQSTDGVAWQRIDDPAAGFADAEIDHVASDGRVLLAAGTRRGAGEPGQTLLWASSDGVTWRASPGADAFAGIQVANVVGDSGGFLAWGTTIDGSLRVSVSEDGVVWRSADTAPFAGGVVDDIGAYRGGWVAVGTVVVPQTNPPTVGGQSPPARAWWSADGITWFRATIPAGPQITSAFPGSDGVLAVGSAECSGCIAPANLWQGDGREWHGPVADAQMWPQYASDGRRIVRWDFQGDLGVHWSTDGSNWHGLGGPVGMPAEYVRLIPGSRGLLLVLATGDPVEAGVQFIRGS